MSKTYFNPGCALSIYKPEIENKILKFLNENYGEVTLHKICCHHNPQLEAGSLIINVCAGCDRRFRSLYEGISTIDGLDAFQYPDYKGLKLSVHDACPVREKPQVHKAVRNLLKKMNIDVVETKFSGTNSICCGDDFYPKLPIEKVHQKMKERADAMPCNEVCVYCVSCIKSMYIGGKTPRHLVDLLIGQTTEPQIWDTVKWHEQLQDYIDKH
ncbi:(Fe-S)-binding protein [Clostridium sporogenes]|uniref:(Fe-S)-binding protein n=1 Tax=Clostridium sporogenes TaxID=1509 RepID=UPI000773DBBB|nr:(Fe-S)-binding protein [Clostridium sporogenes]NFG02830.1 (Fe-S)-binding protein [Clostridium sporogenes]NFP67467.1 (Fe-S)-binding protein [Clostridium sporogenes]NFU86542.1 (Fe-S)-binding protein [Clostridium sporogenes]UAL63849.1 (Fe-S)-binding protein [Clostridium sporogenes]